MADRFFPNEMPDFAEEVAEEEPASDFPNDSLTKLFSLPYKTLADILKSAALDLKQTVPKNDSLFLAPLSSITCGFRDSNQARFGFYFFSFFGCNMGFGFSGLLYLGLENAIEVILGLCFVGFRW